MYDNPFYVEVIMKRYIYIGMVLLIFPFLYVDATSVSSIDMDIYIENDGDAVITETWDVNVDEGTEGYHPYYNLGNSTISDLSVSMDGQAFTTVYDWNIDGSFIEKAYKAGLYQASSDEVDICFGISSYGYHIYEIRYTISGFVAGLNDYDMVYWNLFPHNFSAQPNNVSVTIYSDFRYSGIELHGYGKYGAYNELRDGKIYIDSRGSVASDEYITILVKFPKGTFDTSNELDNNFNYYYDMAEEGAINYNDKPQTFIEKVVSVIINFFVTFFELFVMIIIVGFALIKSCDGKRYTYRFGKGGNKVKKDVNNFRDIPCNKDIYRAYWVAKNYNLTKKKEDFLGAILLKWLQNGNVKVEKIEKDRLFKDKIQSNIIFVKQPIDCNIYEIDLYNWMYEASLDGKLESGEFKKWCKKNYSKILKWFDDVLDFESKMLADEGKVSMSTVTKFKVLKFSYYDVDDSMMQEAEQMAGLRKFLKEFTLIKTREPIEVNLWNEYLMYAQIFGIADEVAKQFKKLYPEIMDDMNSMGYDYDDIVFIHMISYDGMRSANAAQSSANSHSSGGGGGGSFGGGGGGGGFR